ncbi:MAG: AtpZ/AtpI family protein [Acidobacteriota bacterium]|nr:AtpZ/AtpI family protein [Acidobacteriota bacterium]
MNASEPPGRSRASAVAEGTSAGVLFLAAPLAGYFLGRWLGRQAGWGDWTAWTGGVLGLAAAFVNFFRLAARLSR